ncbi:hypothetical protein EC890511_2880, partial [Escherichia coli 89.0511]|jgi:hypothetical protein
MRD